jgi:small subunit ribosomal protein S1
VGAEIDALVHISDLCWVQNFESPAEIFKKGDKISVIILHVDPENERFSAGVRQLLDDPWDIIHKKYALGKEAVGKLTQRTKLGLAVELEPGVEGLIAEEEAEGLKVGDAVTVIVKELDPNARKFVLTPKQ